MARINIEDSLFEKRAWFRLLMITQDEDKALGAVVRAFKTAQRYWFPDKKLIPVDVWEQEKLSAALLESELVVLTEDGYYVRGSEESFAWLFKKSEAGKKSAENRQAKPRRAKQRSTPFNGVQHSQGASTSSSSSFSFSDSVSNSEEREGGKTPSAPALPILAEIWNANSGTLPKVRGCQSKRKRQAEARWQNNPDRAYWVDVIARIAASAFCTGNNDRGWRADFDFLIQPETQHKVLEGKYDSAGGGQSAGHIDWSKLA